MMNKFIKYFTGALLSIVLFSCNDFLDKEYDLALSENEIFNDEANTRGFLANMYNNMPNGFAPFTNGQFKGSTTDAMTDNAVSYWNVHYWHGVQTDSYDATNNPFLGDYWTNYLVGIRKANQFMKNAKVSVLGNAMYQRNMAEAKLLRAMFHFELIRWFGAAPIIGDNEEGVPVVFDISNSEEMNMERTPPAEALKWVAAQCDMVKDILPWVYPDQNIDWGRVTGAAAYALKSRALLYRASPLNNPNNTASYWAEAAQAARDFISVNNQKGNHYRLYSTGNPDNDYYECFTTTPMLNYEYILCFEPWATTSIETSLAPCGFAGQLTSAGRTNPTQNLVDCYETMNGLPIDKDPTYNPQNPYVNRDPRFYQTIFHHGSMWGDQEQEEYRAVDVSTPAGKDYKELHVGTNTGYYLKKYVNNISYKNPSSPIHGWPVFRYGEILLNAAEAVNEAEGPDAAYTYINQIRDRVGMPSYSGMSQEQLRERIRNERRIELAFEDHRFFDERRWMIFEGQDQFTETNLPMYKQYHNLYGVVITLPGPVYTYQLADAYPTRAFVKPKSYLFPIPESDVKRAPLLGQNPGWELSK